MKVRRQGTNFLELGGLPEGVGWPIFAIALGVLFPWLFWLFEGRTLRKPGAHWYLWGVSAVVVLLCATFVVVGVKLLLERERLTLDKGTGRGLYERWNVLWGRRRTRTFELSRVREVRIDIRTESTPGRRGGGSMRVFEATIRPGKKIVLDTTSNGRDERVRRVAREVSAYLGVGLRTTDRSGEPGADTEVVEGAGDPSPGGGGG